MTSPLQFDFEVATALGPHDTRTEVEHRGWERLGKMADAWRDRNRTGCETLPPHFARAI